MIKVFEDEKEEAAAATQNEHAFGRRAMEVQILDAFTIQSQPRLDVCILGVSSSAVRIPPLDFAGAFLIDLRQQRPKRQAKNGALRSAPAAPVTQRLGKFADFTEKFHFKNRGIVGQPLRLPTTTK